LKTLYLKLGLGLLLAIIGSLAFVSFFITTTFQVKAFQFRVGLEFLDWGTTEILIPPIGKISAATHKTPLKLVVTLLNIDMEILKNMLKDPITKQEIIDLFVSEIYKALRLFALRSLFLAAVGGAFGMLILQSKKITIYLVGALIGVLVVGILLLGTYYTYNVNGFLKPEYKGILRAAPWMVGLAEEALIKVDKLEEQMEVVATNFYDLFQRIDSLQPLGSLEDTVKVLHVSDIHNNPASYQFIKKVVQSFGVSMVIDTGDITDYGTPLETKLVEEVGKLGIPYVFVGGNHDSPTVVESMASLDNVIVLDGNLTSIKGIPIAGIADPSSYSNEIITRNIRLRQKQVDRLKQVFLETKEKPVIIATHSFDIAQEFIGIAPIILHGHDHKYSIKKEKETVIIDAGTSGAAGIRRLQTTEEIPYTVVLLHFKKVQGDWLLLASDLLKISSFDGVFTLTRKIFND